jgi:cell division protein FtsL
MTIKELTEKFKDYVTIERFSPIEKFFYLFMTTIFTGLIVAALALILRK